MSVIWVILWLFVYFSLFRLLKQIHQIKKNQLSSINISSTCSRVVAWILSIACVDIVLSHSSWYLWIVGVLNDWILSDWTFVPLIWMQTRTWKIIIPINLYRWHFWGIKRVGILLLWLVSILRRSYLGLLGLTKASSCCCRSWPWAARCLRSIFIGLSWGDSWRLHFFIEVRKIRML